MPRTCTICTHARRGEIDAALLNETPYRHTAAALMPRTAENLELSTHRGGTHP